MANTIEYVDSFNGQALTGLDRSVSQPLLLFAFINNGTTGVPCANSTQVWITPWTIETDAGVVNTAGTRVLRSTTSGFALVSGAVAANATIREMGWGVSLTNANAASVISATFNHTGGGNNYDGDYFTTEAVQHPAVIGDGRGLLTWDAAISKDSRLLINYQMILNSVTGTNTTNLFSLQTGLTNGTSVTSEISARHAVGTAVVAPVPASISNSVVFTPGGSPRESWSSQRMR